MKSIVSSSDSVFLLGVRSSDGLPHSVKYMDCPSHLRRPGPAASIQQKYQIHQEDDHQSDQNEIFNAERHRKWLSDRMHDGLVWLHGDCWSLSIARSQIFHPTRVGPRIRSTKLMISARDVPCGYLTETTSDGKVIAEPALL